MNDPFGQGPQDAQAPQGEQHGAQDPHVPVAGGYESPSAEPVAPAPMPPSYQPAANVPSHPAEPMISTPGSAPIYRHSAEEPAAAAPAYAAPMSYPPAVSPQDSAHGEPASQSGASPANATKSGRASDRLWLKVGAASLAAACVASLGTAALTGAFTDSDAPAPLPQATAQTPIAVPVSDSTSENPNWTKVSQAVSGSVVAITVEFGNGGAEGSGVMFDADGHIVTNNHVIEGGENGKVTVTLADGRIYDAEIVGTDLATDLAVIKLKNPPTDLTPATFGDSDKVVVGESVIAIGNPLGLSNTATTGIVSALNRPVETGTSAQNASVTNAIQIDAAINPGNSGGPAFNAQGQVIGITSSIATLSQGTSEQSGSIGLGFAIPANVAKDVATQLIQSGAAKHAFLGVNLKEGTATVGDVTTRGAEVTSVTPDSPASAAGLQMGDVITSIDGNTVTGSVSLSAYVRSRQSGDVVTLVYVRDGSKHEIQVTLAERADTTATPAPTQTPQSEQPQNGSGMFDPFGLFGNGQQQGGGQ